MRKSKDKGSAGLVVAVCGCKGGEEEEGAAIDCEHLRSIGVHKKGKKKTTNNKQNKTKQKSKRKRRGKGRKAEAVGRGQETQ